MTVYLNGNDAVLASAAPPIRETALAYRLLLSSRFGEAAQLLKRMSEQAPDPDQSLPVLLAWSQMQSGDFSAAPKLIGPNPVPQPAGADTFESFWFPRLFYLRGMLAEHANRLDEARAAYGTFLKLSGGQPLIWGEEKAARDKLAALGR